MAILRREPQEAVGLIELGFIPIRVPVRLPARPPRRNAVGDIRCIGANSEVQPPRQQIEVESPFGKLRGPFVEKEPRQAIFLSNSLDELRAMTKV